MITYLFKVTLMEKENDVLVANNTKVIVKADSQREATQKLFQHYNQYKVIQQCKGMIDDEIT